MPDARNLRILVCPLDWGLGHATRCIPLIRALQSAGARVILGADGPQLKLLRAEFQEAEWLEFPGYQVKYGGNSGAAYNILLDAPRLIYKVVQEHFQLKSLIKKHRIDGVISDNRYGLWNRNIKTVFITHQLNIIAPPALKFAEPFLRIATRYFAKKFDECWIPDTPGEDNLSGRLSHGFGIPENAGYTGLLSRFDKHIHTSTGQYYDIVALLSGPEPQRGRFETILLGQLPVEGKKCLLVRGIPGETNITNLKENLDIVNHLTAEQLYNILILKPILISRSGYSTLMDLSFTGNRAVLVPTPGQTEQEYLALLHFKKGRYYSCKQQEFQLTEAVRVLEDSISSTFPAPVIKYPHFIKNYLESIQTH